MFIKMMSLTFTLALFSGSVLAAEKPAEKSEKSKTSEVVKAAVETKGVESCEKGKDCSKGCTCTKECNKDCKHHKKDGASCH